MEKKLVEQVPSQPQSSWTPDELASSPTNNRLQSLTEALEPCAADSSAPSSISIPFNSSRLALPECVIHAWGLRGTFSVTLKFSTETGALEDVWFSNPCLVAKQLIAIITAAANELFQDGKWVIPQNPQPCAAPDHNFSSAAASSTPQRGGDDVAQFKLSPAKAKIYEELCTKGNFSEEEAFQRALMTDTLDEALRFKADDITPEQLEWIQILMKSEKQFTSQEALEIGTGIASVAELLAACEAPSWFSPRERVLYAKLAVADQCDNIIDVVVHCAGNSYDGPVDVVLAICYQQGPKYLSSSQRLTYAKMVVMGYSHEHAAEAASYTKNLGEALDFPTLAANGNTGERTFQQLIDMGFEFDQARAAAARFPESTDDAANALFDGLILVTQRKTVEDSRPTRPSRGNASPLSKTAAAATSVSINRQAANYNALLDVNKHVVMQTPPGGRCSIIDYLTALVEKRLPTLAQYCTQCDLPHLCYTGTMPVICTREACIRRRNLEVREIVRKRVSALSEDFPEQLSHGRVVVQQLLVDFIVEAARSSRRSVVLKPFPSIGLDDNKLVLDANAPDYKKLLELAQGTNAAQVDLLMRQVQQAPIDTTTVADEEVENRAVYRFLLVQWLQDSNQCHLELLGDILFPEMQCQRQFMLIAGAPEHEAAFAQHLQKPGTTRQYAFHGSPSENWHSILRNQLKNASGTSLEVHGQRHGKGIYVAPNVSQALKYCGGSASSFYCVALCEVAVDPERTAVQDHQWCWTILDESRVVTRFLFVYPTKPVLPSVLASSDAFAASVELALKSFQFS